MILKRDYMSKRIKDFSEGNLSVPQYSVGDVANILGIHPNTVRYFDKVGIVSPERDDSNGRRTYTPYEVYLLTLRRQYQNMGFSVAETDRIFKDYSLDEILKNFDEKCREQEEKIEREKLILLGTERLAKTIENIPYALNRCFLQKRPAMWRHPHQNGVFFTNDSNNIKARNIFTKLMPFGYYSFKLLQNTSSDDERNNVKWDMVLSPEVAEKYGFDKVPGTVFEPEKTCIYTVFRIRSTEVVSRKHLEYIDNFIHQNKLRISGDISGSVIINICENGEQVRYFEAWIPIDNKR